MKYKNPVLRGMYPDPSICRAGDKYYMVCSSMMYFPGVPLFESEDMVNWKQIGHCLTEKSQIDLSAAEIYSGVFAPTIRYNKGRFYMVTTNSGGSGNFYVYTDDIYGKWSGPIFVDQDGIDPSLYFEGEKAYFMSNSNACVMLSEIDISSGKLIGAPKVVWNGTGGRFLEAPHLYKFGEYYYILDAEGGTEYGHMINYARSRDMFGPYEPFPGNPALTNRDLGGYILQGIGHGDILQDKNGNWWCMCLGFRQQGQWAAYHHLGRECCLVPVSWKDGWFYIGDGRAALEYDLPDIPGKEQQLQFELTFENMGHRWCFIREPIMENYRFSDNSLTLTGTELRPGDGGSPTFAAFRQTEFEQTVSVKVESDCEEAGVCLFMNGEHRYEVFLDGKGNAALRVTVGCATQVKKLVPAGTKAGFTISADAGGYDFFAETAAGRICLGRGDTQHLSTEVAGGFTGVMIGLYAVDSKRRQAKFTGLNVAGGEQGAK